MSGNFPSITENNQVRINQSIRDLYLGRSNAVGDFTLAPGETSTVVTAINCGDDSKILLMPRTANAASALTTTYIAVGDVKRGFFTVTHASSADTDLDFSYAIQG